MKTRFLTPFFYLLINETFRCEAQGTFQNLRFENATLIPVDQFTVRSDAALPGWTIYLNNVQSQTILHDDATLDLWSVSIHDSQSQIPFLQPIAGLYSVFLQGGDDPQMTDGPAAIAQTGQIGADRNSLLFKASHVQGSLEVSFKGQILPFTSVATAPTYTLYGADISSFAGQTGELRFTTPLFGSEALIDDIQFSTQVVPEPSTLAMFAIGCGVLLTVKDKGRNVTRNKCSLFSSRKN